MTITIRLTTDNAAFGDDEIARQAEILRTVRAALHHVEAYDLLNPKTPHRSTVLADSNGNTIGTLIIAGR